MASIVEIPRPTAALGLSLVFPAYKSAFVSVGKVWMPLALGGCIAIASASLKTPWMDDQVNKLGGVGIGLVLPYLALLLFLYLIVSAKVWTGCFNAATLQSSEPRTLFGRQEKAAFGALLEVTLASCFLSLALGFALGVVAFILNFATNGAIFFGSGWAFAFSASMFMIHQAIVARYLMAIPMSVADVSSDSFKSDLLGQAWRRTEDWYPTLLTALIPIALLCTGADFGVDTVVKFVFSDTISILVTLVSGSLNYAVYVISALASTQVILKVWSTTQQGEFD